MRPVGALPHGLVAERIGTLAAVFAGAAPNTAAVAWPGASSRTLWEA